MTESLIESMRRMAALERCTLAAERRDNTQPMKTPTLSRISHHVDDLEDTLYKSTTTLANAPRPALDNLKARLARLQRLVEEAARP